jgi:hypothetical protein
VYLYDLRHRTAPFSFWRALAYFFMLPNVCFPLFPVVDYKTFCATHYAGPPTAIYQRGLRWMLRGVLQLLLYRLVYQILQVNPQDVMDLGDVLRFMVATFLLYLKVSGTFHLAVGLLHLFGFALPEANHRYLLARSFLDLWRRINIYWKDFILKIFFNPAYFRLKRLGPTGALVLATLYAFFWTWLLHAYQTFWLSGRETLTSGRDAVFWSVLGILVLASALYEARRSRRRTLGGERRTLGGELARALGTIVTFVTLLLLWTFWSCQSLEELEWLAEAAGNVTMPWVVGILLGLVGLGVAALAWGHSVAEPGGVKAPARPEGSATFWRSAAGVALACGCLLFVGAVPNRAAVRETAFGDLLLRVTRDQLSARDRETLLRGYYEDLEVTPGSERAQPWPYRKYHNFTHDFMVQEGIPNSRVEFNGKTITLNRWGMRDRDHDKAKPAGVYRIAILGSSAEAGYGIDDGEDFPALLEERLNREDAGATGRRYEVLNFSVAAFGAYQKLELLRREVFDFHPDLVLFVSYAPEPERTADQLAKVVRNRVAIPSSCREVLSAVLGKAGVDPSMSIMGIKRGLLRNSQELIGPVFALLAEWCQEKGVPAAVLYRPQPTETGRLMAGARQELLNLAKRAGLPVLDLTPAFAEVADRETLMVTPPRPGDPQTVADDHPNALGHRLLADELYRQLHTPEGRLVLQPIGPQRR